MAYLLKGTKMTGLVVNLESPTLQSSVLPTTHRCTPHEQVKIWL